jgi:hypothetical protein
MNGGRQMLGTTSKMKLKKWSHKHFFNEEQKDEWKRGGQNLLWKFLTNTFGTSFMQFLFIAPKNTNLQRSTELLFMWFLFAITQQE